MLNIELPTDLKDGDEGHSEGHNVTNAAVMQTADALNAHTLAADPHGDRAAASSALAGHRAASTPHPAYDDLPSLALLFENGLI